MSWSRDNRQDDWPRLLDAMVVALHRAGGHSLSPDDAAVLGGTLASVAWLQTSQAIKS